jgi:CheY-like chemotaxis protein
MSNAEHPVILLAEDSEDDVYMVRRAFQQTGIDLPLQVVSNGEQAIAYLMGQGKFANRAEYPLPDLFLLDLKMPRKNGFDVLIWLRQHPTLAPLRTVVLTTSDEIRDVNRAYALGANSFLTKPLDFTDFKNTLQEMFNFFLMKAKAPEISRPPLVNPAQVRRPDSSSEKSQQ